PPDLRAAERRNDCGCRGVGHFDEGGVVGDLDGADVAAADAGFVGNGADEVLGADASAAADADEDAGGVRVGGAARLAWTSRFVVATGSGGPLTALPALRPLAHRCGVADLLVGGRGVGLVSDLDGGHGDVHDVELGGEGLDDDAVVVHVV